MKLAELARVLGATLEGTGADVEITGVAPLEDAGPGTLTFLADRRLEAHLAATRASAVLLGPDAPPSPVPALRVPHPYVAFVARDRAVPPARSGRRPASIPRRWSRRARVIGPGAFVGPLRRASATSVRIGRDAVLHPRRHDLPRRAHRRRLHGARGRRGARGRADRRPGHAARRRRDRQRRLRLSCRCPDGHRKIPQVGTVVLEDDVEIGANATVDRAALGATRDRPRHQDRQPGDGRPRLRRSARAACWRRRSVWRAARASARGVHDGRAGRAPRAPRPSATARRSPPRPACTRRAGGRGLRRDIPPSRSRRWRRVSTAMARGCPSCSGACGGWSRRSD